MKNTIGWELVYPSGEGELEDNLPKARQRGKGFNQ